jgi:hypothetical protein
MIFIIMELKYCKICNEKKPESDFYSTQNSLLCKHHHKMINNLRKKELRKSKKYKDDEKIKTQERKIRLWENLLVSSSKKRNCEHTITVKDVKELYKKQNGLCYWFKVPLLITLEHKHPQKPSLDRLDRNKGYTKDNVVLTCYAANIGRNETDVDKWKEFVDLIFNPTKIYSQNSYDSLLIRVNEINKETRDEFVIYNENLECTTTYNLNEYARKNNISLETISASRKKIKRKIQKGLIILNRTKNEIVEKRIYKLTSPNNEIYKLFSLRDFCLKNNLNDSALQRVAKNQIKNYKGWKCEYETILLK